MIRFVCVAGLIALAGAAAALGASSAPSAGGPVIASGTLTDAAGEPTAGTVRVYPWPHLTEPATLPVLGETRVGSDGRFTVRAADEAQLERFARQRDGYLTFTVVAETVRYRDERNFTGFVGRTRDGLRVVDSDEVLRRAGTARIASADAPAPQVTARARVPRPLLAHASQQCKNERQVQPVRRTRESTVVGELNNAYNDGTWARFIYGRLNEADSHIGVAWDPGYEGVGPIIQDEEHITDAGEARFPTFHRRAARRMRSSFEYQREAVRNNTCAVWDVYVRPVSWIGGHNSRTKQRGTLNKCLPGSFPDAWEGGGGFKRLHRETVRWKRGVAAFGFYLTAQSGFSEHVTLEYGFGGPKRKRHYLCGADGKESPFTAGRVFSGAKR